MSLRKKNWSIGAWLFLILASFTHAQDASSQSGEIPGDQSFYAGTSLRHPEDLSGIWQASNGHGGVVGMQLTLMSTAPATATTLADVEQAWLHLEVALYECPGTAFCASELNGFSDSVRGGSVRYEDGRLTLHYPSFDLDLKRLKTDQWAGRFHRKDFDSQVTLARPQVSGKENKPWFLGTWRSGDSINQGCLHIVQSSLGEFIGWSDSLNTLGSTRFSPTASKPPYSLESYGHLVKVQSKDLNSLSVEFNSFGGFCCAHPFHGSAWANGTIMKADWPAGMNQSPHKSEWTKMPGSTCIAATP